MSCYEWERGEIKLSTKEYPRVKKAFIEAIQKSQEEDYNNAIKLYEKMIAHAKGKRGINWYTVYHACRIVRSPNFRIGGYTDTNLDDDDKFLRLNKNFQDNKKPLKPKKKDYLKNIDRKKVEVEFEDAHVLFEDSHRKIHWSVGENNHSTEHAHSHPLGKALFKILDTVKWTRGTGGTIVGNDEYNQDSDCVGGGGNYVTMSFGPDTKKKSERYHYVW